MADKTQPQRVTTPRRGGSRATPVQPTMPWNSRWRCRVPAIPHQQLQAAGGLHHAVPRGNDEVTRVEQWGPERSSDLRALDTAGTPFSKSDPGAGS